MSRFRGDRRSRRSNGKSDAVDAEAAARSVLAGTSTAIPKTADGLVEMIRQVKVARDTARKSRTTAIITVGAMTVNAPAELRESLDGLTNKALINRCARYRVSTMNSYRNHHQARLWSCPTTSHPPPRPTPQPIGGFRLSVNNGCHCSMYAMTEPTATVAPSTATNSATVPDTGEGPRPRPSTS